MYCFVIKYETSRKGALRSDGLEKQLVALVKSL